MIRAIDPLLDQRSGLPIGMPVRVRRLKDSAPPGIIPFGADSPFIVSVCSLAGGKELQ